MREATLQEENFYWIFNFALSLMANWPTGKKYSLELMFAKFATVKIAKDLNSLKIFYNRLLMPENKFRAPI